jgi:pilus assembly protein CpaF
METRPANVEGVGEIAQRDLVRNCLRMRPDRIILGEVRGAEAFDMLQAMSTGHDGSVSTIHANSPRDALYRLENMVMMANVNVPLRAIRMQMASALNLIVQMERMRDGVRRVVSIVEVAGLEGETIAIRKLFDFVHQGEQSDLVVEGVFRSSRTRPDLVTRAARYGLEAPLLQALGIAGA